MKPAVMPPASERLAVLGHPTRWAMVAALGCASPFPLSAQDGAPPPADEFVAAQRDRELRMTVPVTIAGKGPYRFLVDTGAQATVLARHLVEELALTATGRATLVGMASKAPVETVELDGMVFAEREMNGMVAPLLDGSNIGADGIIGLDSLQGLRVTMDMRADSLAVGDAGDRAANRGYEIVVRARAKLGQMIITRASFDGVRTAVIIDTGSQLTIGNDALRARLRARARAKMTSRDVNGALLESEVGVANKLEIDRLDMNDIPIAFTDSPVFEALGLGDTPTVILGLRNLRLFDRVAIDFATHKILFDLPPGAGSR